ncbi:GNAT family N-acetyltransferase, partial [Klebsiella pneumoniae]|nr:GNAT family N-acetyltransferase [Klebsiella pneumoniae]
AARFHLRCRRPDSAEAFQVHPLSEDALDGVHRQVEYSEH